MGIYHDTIWGKLIAKQEGEGSMSDGPVYSVIPMDKYSRWGKIRVRKKVHLWQEDPQLHPYVNEIVSIYGEIIETKDTITMEYSRVEKKPSES